MCFMAVLTAHSDGACHSRASCTARAVTLQTALFWARRKRPFSQSVKHCIHLVPIPCSQEGAGRPGSPISMLCHQLQSVASSGYLATDRCFVVLLYYFKLFSHSI